MRIFIIGDEENVNSIENFERAENALHSERGCEVINPAKIAAMLPASMLQHEKEEFMMTLLTACDSVYLMPDWRKSKIAHMLAGFARARDMRRVDLTTPKQEAIR